MRLACREAHLYLGTTHHSLPFSGRQLKAQKLEVAPEVLGHQAQALGVGAAVGLLSCVRHICGEIIMVLVELWLPYEVIANIELGDWRQRRISAAIDLSYQQWKILAQMLLTKDNVHCQWGVGACRAAVCTGSQAHALPSNVQKVEASR